MNRKGRIWPALILFAVVLVVCSAFYINLQQSELTVSDLEEMLKEEQEKNKVLEEELSRLKWELEDFKEKRNSSPDESKEDETKHPPAKDPPASPPQDSDRNAGGSGPVAYLTFDDGPSVNTVRILDTLKQYNIRATFFVTGNNTTGSTDIYRRIVSEGHTLGNHTYTHNFNTIYQSTAAFMEDFLRQEDFLDKTTGVKTDIMRFPGGSASAMAQQVSGYNIIVEDLKYEVKANGYDYFDWNVNSGDGTANLTAEEIVDNVLKNADRVNGDIVVLFHDSQSRHTTAEALPEVIQKLEQRGYEFSSLRPGAIKIKHR
jgi:peptidoglycan-N-acetylglucosamine deacetylase